MFHLRPCRSLVLSALDKALRTYNDVISVWIAYLLRKNVVIDMDDVNLDSRQPHLSEVMVKFFGQIELSIEILRLNVVNAPLECCLTETSECLQTPLVRK